MSSELSRAFLIHTIADEQYYSTGNGQDNAHYIDTGDVAEPENAADKPADNAARNPNKCGDNDPAGIVTGQNEFGDNPRDKP